MKDYTAALDEAEKIILDYQDQARTGFRDAPDSVDAWKYRNKQIMACYARLFTQMAMLVASKESENDVRTASVG